MSEINILSPHVADLIAAGEVVDRPASVVKELMENAFDAGAKTVTVEIRKGGTTYIRVTDDGKGMRPEDAGIAFLRHATSKLENERGLECIGTFGFRGEALAAISAVSRIEMLTRRREAPVGVRMTLTAGDIQEMYETGCPEGTTMIVRDLFYNTPARLKFMKSDRAEGSACVQAAMKCALGRPDISVRCIKDGKEEFFSPGDGDIRSCIYHLLGRDMTKSMLNCVSVDEFIRVSGMISSPAEGRGNRTAQYFFVNGRAVKSQLLQKALEMAYRNRLLTGRFPYCVLYIDIPYGNVDVNVHPTKAEVKFSNEKNVYDAVYYTCLEAVGREDRLAEESRRERYWQENDKFFDTFGHYPAKEAKLTPEQLKDPLEGVEYDERGKIVPTADGRERERYDIPLTRKQSFVLHDAASPAPAVHFERYVPKPAPAEEATAPADVLPVVQEPVVQGDIALTMEPVLPEAEAVPDEPEAPEVLVTMEEVLAQERSFLKEVLGPFYDEPEAPVQQEMEAVCKIPLRVVGEVLHTYIIVEHEDKMTLIDKHAAHERMHFDRLSAYETDAPSQVLLVPEVLRLGREDHQMVWENLSSFEALGYELEEFGDDALILRSVPAGIRAEDGRAGIEELCETLRAGRAVTYEQVRQELLKTVACKAAIKAGKSSAPEELQRLAEAVLSGRVQYCPHGRPVSVTFTRTQLDKQFDRIV